MHRRLVAQYNIVDNQHLWTDAEEAPHVDRPIQTESTYIDSSFTFCVLI